jgi:site-specific DNA-methyltransferase (adenine-specific)
VGEREKRILNRSGSIGYGGSDPQGFVEDGGMGRWPANLIHDGGDEVLACFPDTKSGKPGVRRKEHETSAMAGRLGVTGEQEVGYGDAGSAARFFYCPKASKRDRDEGLEDMERKASGMVSNTSGKHITRRDEGYEVAPRANNHPTVKPTELMRYLCRLVTPPGGVVLDPFMGSGSTGKGAMLEGFRFIGIERDPDYFEIACRRIEAAYKKEN